MRNFTLVNCDTDSISFSKPDGAPFTEEEQASLLKELNSNFSEKIKWEHDGIYDRFIVLKAKNYILLQDGKVKKKGSSLRSSKTEKAISAFMDEIINVLLFSENHQEDALIVYNKYIRLANKLDNIQPWTSKKTITSKILEPSRTNEQKVLDALGDKNVQMGDKVWLYFTKDGSLKLAENWQGDHDPVHLMKRIYSSLNIFKNVLPLESFPKYHLKNKKIKESLERLLCS